MITLKLRGKHCPVNFTERMKVPEKRLVNGLVEYELNPDTLTDLFDELCEKILNYASSNRDMEKRIIEYKIMLSENKKEEYKIGSRFD